jgi:hypothetical protein
MDFILKNGDNWKIEEFSPDTYGEHPSIEFKYQDMTILLNPFFWHGCDFLIEPKTTDITFLENWTKKWIDEEELLNPLSNGLSGAIHSVTIPIHEENGLTFSIDFGSSMVDSFLSLIDIIQKSGFQKVSINSFQMINKNSD